MKKIFVILVLLTTAFIQSNFAQENPKTPPVQLLNNYYALKDALVSSNTTLAATRAAALVTSINSIDQQNVSQDIKTSLLKDATAISASKDIKLQRENFASLSDSIFELAKLIKLSANPIYQQYCPMKKASWLSDSKSIKNPYYGNAMLTCGSLKTTL